MLIKSYTLEGTPTPLARPRKSPQGRLYDSQKDQRTADGWVLKVQHGVTPLFTGPLLLEATFYFGLPQSYRKNWVDRLERPHVFKPDLSNLIKYIEDVATGILFKDDCIISSINAKKLYSKTPRTEFTLLETGG